MLFVHCRTLQLHMVLRLLRYPSLEDLIMNNFSCDTVFQLLSCSEHNRYMEKM